MGGVLRRSLDAVDRHRDAIRRALVAVLAVAVGLLVVGGAIRVLRAADRAARPAANGRERPSQEWSAQVIGPVTGLALDDGLLYVTGPQLSVFTESCMTGLGECLPRWRGYVPEGPLSAPTVRDDRVLAGSPNGRVYAFPATCGGQACRPDWVGRAGIGPVSQPAANFDLVYVTSDRLYAFPAGCGNDAPCPPAWSADVPGRPAEGPPALGGGLVIVASSTRGGVTAFPAVCEDDCEPVWVGRTVGPATAVTVANDLAYTVARGQLIAFPLSCTGRCRPAWVGPFVPGAPLAAGASSAPAATADRLLVGGDDGRLWVFPSTCDDTRCDPIASYGVAATPLHTASIDGDRAIVTSRGGAVALVDLGCVPADEASPSPTPAEGAEPCPPVRVRPLGASAAAPALAGRETTFAGDDQGVVTAFTW